MKNTTTQQSNTVKNKYDKMPKWDKDRYSNWRQWAEHCFDSGEQSVKEDNEALKEANREMVKGLELMENKICELYSRLLRETEQKPTFKGRDIWNEGKEYIKTVTEHIIKKAKNKI